MKRIIDERSSGKTRKLMLMAKEQDGIVVCSNPSVMREKAFAYGIVGIDFVSYTTYLQSPRRDKPVFIDEIDRLLRIHNPNVMGYSLTNE